MFEPSRRTLISAAVAAAAALAQETKPQANPETLPPLDSAMVREFVGKSHTDLDVVRELATKEPRLVFASQDWGAGDFETGLNAASHMGRRDIAAFLIDRGARPDAPAIFMLGLLPVAKGMLAAFPELHKMPGAHGIPLLSHAIIGKSPETFHLLLEAGADVNAVGWRGFNSPLSHAVIAEQADMVRVLLDRGADRAAKNPAGLTVLEIARKRNLAAIAAILEKS
jgi:hypothetical protein